jgi:thymidylate kinase
MIVEFIGCTGAGKTTLIEAVRGQLAKTAPVTTSAGMLGLQSVANPTVQNLIQELLSFPYFLPSLRRYRAFLRYTIELFMRNSRFSLHTVNNLRSLERKLGMYEIISRHGRDRIVLVDEGPILAAHMFVFTGASYTPQEIARFAALLPLPDLVVYVHTPVETLVKRTRQRPDAPREIDKQDPAQIEHYAASAVALFDQLAGTEPLRCRLLMAESLDLADPGYGQAVEEVARSILHHTPWAQ